MEADLCGHIMIGPRKITQKAVNKAIKAAKLFVKACRKAVKEDKPKLSDTRSYSYYKTPVGIVDADIAEEVACLLDSSSIENCIRSFVNMWNTENSRDLMARVMPGSKTKKIVVCGDRTWGDGPEYESSWWYADLIGDKLGVFKELGIE